MQPFLTSDLATLYNTTWQSPTLAEPFQDFHISYLSRFTRKTLRVIWYSYLSMLEVYLPMVKTNLEIKNMKTLLLQMPFDF